MYQPFRDFLAQSLQQNFELQRSSIPPGLARTTSERGKNPATIQSWCYRCAELPKIRYSSIDAGASAQIFNSVIYPSHHDDLLLFQDPTYQAKYIHPLKFLHERYPDLAQNLEMKFYDANQYFSKYLLVAKTDPETVSTRVFAAFQDISTAPTATRLRGYLAATLGLSGRSAFYMSFCLKMRCP